MNRAGALLDWAFSRPEHPGIVTDQRSYSFTEVRAGVLGAASRLADVVAPGTKVALYIDSTPNFVLYQYATFYLGGVVTPLNRGLTGAEVTAVLDRLGIDVLVTDAATAWPGRVTAVVVDGEFDAPQAGELGPPRARSLDDPAQILQTSGSTGQSKGVLQTVGNLVANYDPTYRWIGVGRDDTVLLALPIFNTYALNQGINLAAMSGATLRLTRRFKVEHIAAVLEQERPTFFPTVPTMITRLRRAGVRHEGRIKVGIGAAPSPTKIAADAWSVFPDAELYTGYGLTEATAIVSLNHIGTAQRHHEDLASVGRLVSGVEVRIATTDPADDRGEVLVHGDLVATRYVGSGAEVPVEDGWLHTGDIGRLTDGRLHILDRAKDMLIRGGQNIYPGEVERALTEHPGVLEAAVVGRPDADLGEVPVAFVVLRPGRDDAGADIRAWAAARIAAFKVPERVQVVEEMPRGATGKIQKSTLRDQLS